MATITTSGVLADLKNGYTRLKKDDKGHGSIEEKYGLTVDEVKELFQTPSLKAKKTALPKRKLEIIDDLAVPQAQVGGLLVGRVDNFDLPAMAEAAPITLDSLAAHVATLAPEALPEAKNVQAEAGQNTKDSIFA